MTAAADAARADAPRSAAGIAWDLSHLVPEPAGAAIEQSFDTALAAAREFAGRYRGRLASLGAGELAAALDALEALLEPVARAASYASLRHAGDAADPANGALLQRVQERGTEVHSALLFFDLEWAALGDAHAAALLAEPALARRRHYLASQRRYRSHLLSEPEERVLEELANTGERAWSRLFDEVMAGARFPVERAGLREELSEEETLSLLYSPDREARRAGARGLTRGLKQHARVLTYVFNTLVQHKATEDRLRSYAEPTAARHLANEIDAASVHALLGACERHHPLVQRYYHLKARLLGIAQLEDFDRYAPLPEAPGRVPFAAAKRIVLDAYRDFAPELAQVAQRFFDERWIDAELRPGKTSGAFSAATVPSVHPYVLLNYTETQRDVMTLAHELGHGVHQWLAREQGLFEQNTPLTTAETASVFGEMLVFRRLLREERDPRARLALLCGKIDDAVATVFRQVVLTRFEEALHAARRREGELTSQRIDALWLEANRPMYGDAVKLTDDYASWWLYIPHFVHTPFYCYAYAFGELLVLALLRRYDEEGAAFVPRYLALLRAGGSEPPAALLAKIGLAIDDPAFWEGGLQLLGAMVDEAEALAAQLA